MSFARSMLASARRLAPGSFAAVMATGVVSIDAGLHGMPWLAQALFVLNLLMFVCLCVLSALRAIRFRPELMADFVDPNTGASFLTFVAAAGVLTAQCLLVVNAPRAAHVFGSIAAIAWFVLIYAFFGAMITRKIKRGLAQSIHAGWLVLIVATQSVAVVTFLISANGVGLTVEAMRLFLFAGLCLYLIGGALYLQIITLVVYRMVFLPLRAQSLKPPYWINMGALAITTLAGSLFVLHVPDSGPLAELKPFVKGFTLFFWATASWWIPLLLLLGFWRHIRQQVPIRYEVDYWNIVFPVAMYTVGTFELAHALNIDALLMIPAIGVYASLLVWAIVAFGWLLRLIQGNPRVQINHSKPE